MKIAILLLLLYPVLYMNSQPPPLFRIVEGGKTGYINEKGEVVIKPVFLNGHDFADGLASVRENGLYGFIDHTGHFIIPPQYDFATNFVRGLVGVQKDGNFLGINKEGAVVLPAPYTSFVFIDDKTGIVTTKTKKSGVFSLVSRQLLIDTVFGSMQEFTNGVSVVTEYTAPGKKRKNRVGVIDLTGKWIVPFGRYTKINPFFDGYAVVEMDDKSDEGMEGVITTRGDLLFKKPQSEKVSLEGDFHDGFAKVTIQISPKFNKKKNSTDYTYYEGYLDLKGELAFNDTTCQRVTDFCLGRAFVQYPDGDYVMIDRSFRRIGELSFLSIFNDRFQDGYAIVETDKGYGVIDTMGIFVIQPVYEDVNPVGIANGYFFYSREQKDKTYYGIADVKGNTIDNLPISDFDRLGFSNGLLQVTMDGKMAYINDKGTIIWQQKEKTGTGLELLNIDFMNRGYFYAYSSYTESEERDAGGWSIFFNRPHKIKAGQFPYNSLAVTIDTLKTDTFAKHFRGYKLFISNTTGDTIHFNAQDSRLYVKLQATDKEGKWRDIEYLPSSWCGNSYHQLALEGGAYWDFTIPQYQGEFPANIRAELKYVDRIDPKKEVIIYSNAIRGSINPAQFFNKIPYSPNGLMDPYFE